MRRGDGHPSDAIPWSNASIGVVSALCVVKAAVHLALLRRYGYHGDELYFVECGRHLAFGYVDHPPLIPWIARLSEELGGGIVALRLPAVAAGVATMVFAALLVRDWGGGVRAQLLTLLCLLVAPAHLRMAAMLDIPVIEVFLCTATAFVVARALRRGGRWIWVLAGVCLGLAILAKHSSLAWGGALALGVAVSRTRRVLTSGWPWAGLVVALLFAAPNLAWQSENGFATLEFMRELRQGVIAEQGRGLFLAGQLLYFHPLAVPVWSAGLAFGFTRAGAATRPFAILFLVLLAFFFATGGKPYYLASAYPAVLAAGGVGLETWLGSRPAWWRALTCSLAATGSAFAVVTLPLLPIQTVDAALESLLGWAVPPMALTHDLHGMYGWDEHAATVARVYASLPEDQRDEATILAGSYAQASAINVVGAGAMPRAVSGHMTYYLWGPDGDHGEVLIAYGVPLGILTRHYRSCREQARIHAPEARPWDTDLPVYVCRQPLGTMVDLWPDVRRFGRPLGPE